MKTVLKIAGRIVLGFVPLGIIGIVLISGCTPSPEEMIEEAEKEIEEAAWGTYPETAEESQLELLPLGQAATIEGIKFTVVEYIVSKEEGGKPPYTEGAQYLFLHFKVENTSNIAKAPPYSENIRVIYKGKGVKQPPLVFAPTASVGGRELNCYPYLYSFYGDIYPGVVKEGWEAYLVPIEFHPEDTKVIIRFYGGEKVGWTLTK